VILALTVRYDPWRGRLFIFAVGLACAAWGATLRVRWLSVGVTGLCVVTVALSLVHSYTKPSGLGLLESSISDTVWRRDRIDTLTVIRTFDGTPSLLRAVEAAVPKDAELAIATPIDTFLAPLAGPRLERRLTLVADGGRVPRDAPWLVTRDTVTVVGCPASWRSVYGDEANRWRLLERTATDACGAEPSPV